MTTEENNNNTNNDSYVPGKGKIIIDPNATKEEEENLDKVSIALSEIKAKQGDENGEQDPYSEFVAGAAEVNNTSKNNPNWATDISKAQDLFQDDGNDGQEAPITEEERRRRLEEFGAEEKNANDNNINTITLKGADITQPLVASENLRKIMYNSNPSGKCNQKQDIHCNGFDWMIKHDTMAVHLEDWGTGDRMWVIYVLTNPELEYASSKTINTEAELNKARFSIPFRVKKVILKYCPHCGGDLSF